MKKIKVCSFIVALCTAVAGLAGCGGSSEKAEAGITVEDTAYYEKFKDKGISINVYNWGEYIPDGSDDSIDLNAEFEKITGIKVNYSTYATTEELYAKLKAGAANYDIVIPSDYSAGRMISEGMLEEINYDNIPNYKNIMDKFKNLEFDTENKYTVPYTWGNVGIIYDKSSVDLPEDEIDWDVLWDSKYKDNILMFDNPRDAFGIAEIRLGYSINTENEEELKKAAESLKEQKELVQAYVMDEIFDKMSAGEAMFAPYYAGDAITLMEDYDHLGFVLPKSGTNRFVDVMCIPTCSTQKEAAEMYINFMCEPSVAAAVATYIGYSTPNQGAYELLDEDVKNNKYAYPDDEYLANSTTVYINLSEKANRVMQELWTEIKSEN